MADAEFDQDEPVLILIEAEVNAEYDICTGGPARVAPAVVVRYGEGLELTVAADSPNVRILREGDPAADKDLLALAVSSAIVFWESGSASIGCHACEEQAARCREHADDGPTLTAFRELLASLPAAS